MYLMVTKHAELHKSFAFSMQWRQLKSAVQDLMQPQQENKPFLQSATNFSPTHQQKTRSGLSREIRELETRS